MLNVLPISWDAPFAVTAAKRPPVVIIPEADFNTSMYTVPLAESDSQNTLAWEAPLFMPKMSFNAQSRFARAVPAWELQAPDNGFSLATLLKVLELETDLECVLTIRKIHKLGIASANLLRQHFSQFGEVDRVMLLPSRPKASAQGACKIRPASMAFVVMRSRQPAIIARLNEVHMIESFPIQVQKFRRDAQQLDTLEDGPFLPMDNYAWLDETSTAADQSPPPVTIRSSTSTGILVN